MYDVCVGGKNGKEGVVEEGSQVGIEGEEGGGGGVNDEGGVS